jgi:hypothetical protein
MKNPLFLILLLILFFSCQTEIDVKVPEYYDKLVVEGYIENDEYPVVSLYRSAPYFSKMSLEYLMNNILVRDAKVFITSSEGEEQELFINNFLQPSFEYPLFYAYTTKNLVGKLNTSYTLRIEWDDKVYSSETKILNTFDLDSAFFVPRFGHTEIDSVANLRIAMKDNGKSGNYYQFKVKIHCKEFYDRLWITTIPAAFDDSPFKGQSFNYEIIRGAPSTVFMPDMTDKERRRYMRGNYRIGDTVYMKYALLDESSYLFWQSASDDLTFGQNPFMSPMPIISNIRCNTGEKCLGVWCGSAKKEVVLILDTATTKATGSTLSIR